MNLSGTIQSIWDDAGGLSLRDTVFLSTADSKASPNASSAATTTTTTTKDWAEDIAQATLRTYGPPTPAVLADRDADLQRILSGRQHQEVDDCPQKR